MMLISFTFRAASCKKSIRKIKSIRKKTYGHKYYVAASIGFEEKSYPFIRKMK